MPYGSILADTLQSSVSGTPPQFNDGNGTQVGTLCRAWVNFNGTTGTINSSFNVSSVTRNGTGDYTLNFTNTLADTNYAVATTCFVIADQGSAYQFGYYVAAGGTSTTAPTTKTTSQLRMLSRRDLTVDIQNANVSIFR